MIEVFCRELPWYVFRDDKASGPILDESAGSNPTECIVNGPSPIHTTLRIQFSLVLVVYCLHTPTIPGLLVSFREDNSDAIGLVDLFFADDHPVVKHDSRAGSVLERNLTFSIRKAVFLRKASSHTCAVYLSLLRN